MIMRYLLATALALALPVHAHASEWLLVRSVDPETKGNAHFAQLASDTGDMLLGFVCFPKRPFVGLTARFPNPAPGEYQTTLTFDGSQSTTFRMVPSGMPNMIVTQTRDIARLLAVMGETRSIAVSVRHQKGRTVRASFSQDDPRGYGEFLRRCNE